MGGGAKSFQEIKKESGLAHPGLSHQHLEAELTIDPVDQRSERFPVGFTVEEESWVRGTPKGVLPQAKVAKQLILHRVFGGVALHMAPVRLICCKSTAIAEKALVSRISEDTGDENPRRTEKVKAVAAKDPRPAKSAAGPDSRRPLGPESARLAVRTGFPGRVTNQSPAGGPALFQKRRTTGLAHRRWLHEFHSRVVGIVEVQLPLPIAPNLWLLGLQTSLQDGLVAGFHPWNT